MDNHNLKHRLAALLSADVVGYSRLMAQDEVDTIRTLTAYRAEITAMIQSRGGRVVNFVGDNMLAEFTSTLNAVECALSVQAALDNFNAKLAENRRMQFRIGINLGDVAVDGDLIFGDGVNVAARLEAPLILAGANAALDRVEEARSAGRNVLAAKPDFTLNKYAAAQPYKEIQTLEQIVGMLQKAGLK